jgi:hypothetical protein
MTPDQIASVKMAPTGMGGLLASLKDATYTPDTNGMTFWDKLGAFGQTLSHAQAGLDGSLGGAAGGGDPGMATLQAYKDRAAQQAQRQQLMATADQLGMSPREKLIFLANPEEWAKNNASRLGFHDVAGGNTAMYGDPSMGGGALMAAKLGEHGDQLYTQGANGAQVTAQLAQTPGEVAATQTALNGAMTAAKPMDIPQGNTVYQPAVTPALVAGMPGSGMGATPAQAGRTGVLYAAPKTYAPTAGGAGGPSMANIDPNAPNGDAFLSKLPPAQGQIVKALADGRMAFPSGFALKSPYWQGMLQAVAQYDPSFDAINYNARAKTRNDFTSGPSAKNITSLNTVIGHLGQLNDDVDKLGNGDFPLVNAGVNLFQTQTGNTKKQAEIADFESAKTATVDELTKALKGSGGTVHDIKTWESQLNAANSPAALHAVVARMTGLLSSRINSVGEQYSKGMGKTSDPTELLSPEAKAVWQRLNSAEALRGKSAATRANAPKAPAGAETWVPGPNGVPVLSK